MLLDKNIASHFATTQSYRKRYGLVLALKEASNTDALRGAQLVMTGLNFTVLNVEKLSRKDMRCYTELAHRSFHID
jgi:hypothetical protein